ncbi:MAG: hypothetical protein LBB77_02835 [Treponema sp.]|jgi:hypothetical protein|nr:hypothetical protein [Treponema sp.]
MKIGLLNGGLLAALLVLGACTTIDMLTYEDGNIYAELETNDSTRVTLTVDNRGGGDLILDQDRALYTGGGRRSSLTALAETPDGEIPQFRLPSGARRSLSFAPAEAVSVSGGKRKIADWAPQDILDDRFEFTYSMDGEEYPLIFPDEGERPLLGKVNVSLDIAMPFASSVTERRRKIYDLALSQANNAFGGEGKKLRLVNIRYDSTSSGFKEKAILSADVIAGD